MAVFVYLAPPLTALGLAFLVPGERLGTVQWLGVALAFAGIAVAFRDGLAAGERVTVLGDALALAAATLWAATTVMIRATRLVRIDATKTLLYQLAVSAVLLPLASVALGEGRVGTPTPLALASLVYQVVVVAFASYLAWFWMLTRYLASRLAVFSFATPLFGVAFGHLVLNEPISAGFLVAALMLGAGIALVNVRRAVG
jgi:drug/metabolite transporter (DMT)-like permease